MILQESGAPVEFWCYAVDFVVDTLNHTAHEPLGWQTPIEFYLDDTPDISNLRFAFWQDVEFFEPAGKWPNENLRRAKYLGIARMHGDAFSY